MEHRKFVMMQPSSRVPKPFYYRLWIIKLGDICDSEDWRLLVQIADEVFPQQFFTVYPIYQPRVYSEFLIHNNVLLKDKTTILNSDN